MCHTHFFPPSLFSLLCNLYLCWCGNRWQNANRKREWIGREALSQSNDAMSTLSPSSTHKKQLLIYLPYCHLCPQTPKPACTHTHTHIFQFISFPFLELHISMHSHTPTHTHPYTIHTVYYTAQTCQVDPDACCLRQTLLFSQLGGEEEKTWTSGRSDKQCKSRIGWSWASETATNEETRGQFSRDDETRENKRRKQEECLRGMLGRDKWLHHDSSFDLNIHIWFQQWNSEHIL